MIEKDTSPKYKISVADLKTKLESLILAEHGDTVTATGFELDPSDSSFYIIKTE